MKNAVMYGAGNIGRGFIGELFSESGYRVTFIDIDDMVVNQLNARRQYPIRILDDEKIYDIVISNVCAVNGKDIKAAADAISKADIMATAVGGNVLPKIAPVIAAGIKKRCGDGKPLDIIVCENLHDADKILRRLVGGHISDKSRDYLANCVGFVSTSVGRMVPVVTDELKAYDPLIVGVEPFNILPVDARAFKGKIPDIKNMLLSENIAYHTQSKLYIHNMLHSTCAYLGYEKGYEYIYEAVGDSEIAKVLRGALGEISRAISAEHGVAVEKSVNYGEDLIKRFANRALADSVARVGRDTPRKLAYEDRLVGAARLCEKHGIGFEYIAEGIAAALMFAADEASRGVCETAGNLGPAAALEKYSNLPQDSKILKLAEQKYKKRGQRIIRE